MQAPAGILPTKPLLEPFVKPLAEDLKQASNKNERDVNIKVWEVKHTVYSDQPSKFPVQSCSDYSYQVVMIQIDNKVVLAEPMKN